MSKRDLLSVDIPWHRYFAAAIHTELESHRFIWELNRHAASDFWRIPDDLTIYSKNGLSKFVSYTQENDETENIQWIIANTGEKGYLLTASPRPDYLIVAKGSESEEIIESLISTANNIRGVSLAYPLDEISIKKLDWIPYLSAEAEENTHET